MAFYWEFLQFLPKRACPARCTICKNERRFRNRRVSSYNPTGENRDRIEAIEPGETIILADIKGAGIINHIGLLCLQDLANFRVMTSFFGCIGTVTTSRLWCPPIGPFFGQGWNEQYNYASFALSSGPKDGTGLCSYFAMPFAKGARIEIENQRKENHRDCKEEWITGERTGTSSNKEGSSYNS